MVPVRLETSSGEVVSKDEAILPFQSLPEVVIWGQRFFKLHDANGARDNYDRVIPVYRECFTYYITGREKELVRAPTPAKTEE